MHTCSMVLAVDSNRTTSVRRGWGFPVLDPAGSNSPTARHSGAQQLRWWCLWGTYSRKDKKFWTEEEGTKRVRNNATNIKVSEERG